MRLSRRGVRREESRLLWVGQDDGPPHPYLVAACRHAGELIRELLWAMSKDGQRSFGRVVEFGDRTGHEHPMSVKLVSPRMLLELARAPEDVLVMYEFGLVGLYAALSKLFRPHKVISLVEGDYRHSGRTGNAVLKVVVRRLAARFVDVFVANNPSAREYLIRTLNVPEEKIIVGWWLAGMPADLAARPPAAAPAAEVPLFVCAGRLIPQKGTDLAVRALAVYRRRFGPCVLWVIGDGPERESLVQLSRRLGVEEAVLFLGTVDHQALKGAFLACQAFVFPTLQDLTGRVAVEALSAGAPVVASPMTGAVGTIVHDGVNGIVVDPRDASALAEAMHQAADPETSRALREGVRRTSAVLHPDAAGEVVLSAVARARAATPRRVRRKPSVGVVDGRPDKGVAVQTAEASVDRVLDLRVGEIVEVRSEVEILATLDGRGELESLPFMPEMLQFCGRRFRVDKLALKLCDTIGSTGMYRMRNAVHLEGLRCDGQAHGGCQAGCLIYWKEAWLKRVPAGEPGPAPVPRCTRATLTAATRRPADPAAPGEERYACQATELLRAAPERIPAWDARQYLQDVRSGNAGALAMIRTLGIGLFNEYQDASRRLLPRPLRIRAGRRYPFIEGRLQKTPAQTLDLRPGERVRVRRREDVVATLDANNANRGMSFDGEMLRYCEQEATVLRRVERIIDEKSGRMLRFENPCIVLDDVTCAGAYHRQCPRGIYPYWREIWLERVE
jgi:glycosyltransferase involved in cell wall biosynthesis